MSAVGDIGARLAAARPKALAALTRYFRDLDRAEEAFQEASLKALTVWPKNGPPRDPAAWLVMVGRNAGVDQVRKTRRETELPPEDQVSDLDDVEARVADAIDTADYRDDILRLLFVCCHPSLPGTHQVALALRIVAGLSVREIARAFLVSESAMEQRLTRAKRRIAELDVRYEVPSAIERADRLGQVAAAIYLLFNEGYAASGGDAHIRAPLCIEAIQKGNVEDVAFAELAEEVLADGAAFIEVGIEPDETDALVGRGDLVLGQGPANDGGLAVPGWQFVVEPDLGFVIVGHGEGLGALESELARAVSVEDGRSQAAELQPLRDGKLGETEPGRDVGGSFLSGMVMVLDMSVPFMAPSPA